MRSNIIVIIIITMLLLTSKLQSQQLKGTVYELNENKQKQPLAGVTIYWKNTKKVVVSDTSGNFAIDMPAKNIRDLIISYVGYETDTLTITETQSEIEIILTNIKQLSEVIISGTKSSVYIAKLEPRHTQIITTSELHRAACCNLSESFETNASVDVSYQDAVTGAKQIKLLGLTGVYGQLMTENIPNFRGAASAYGLEYIPGPWMESIQISKGASTVVNGFESITGLINVEYKKPEKAEKLYVNIFTNEMQKLESNLYASTVLKNNWSTLSFAHGEYMNMKIDANNDSFLDMPLHKQLNLFNRWEWHYKEKFETRFGFKTLYEDRLSGQYTFNPNIKRDTLNGYGININTNRYEAFAKAGFMFPKRHETSLGIISSYTYHQLSSYFGLRNYDVTQNNAYFNIIYQSYIKNTNHKYNVGASYIFDSYLENFTDSIKKRNENIPGVFAQYTYSYLNKLTLIVGMRSDYNSFYNTFFTPRIHFKYNFRNDITLRISAGKGYRSPIVIAENLFLLANSKKIFFSEPIRQENAWNYGTSLTNEFHKGNKKTTITTEIFRTDFINQLVIDADKTIDTIFINNINGTSYANNAQIEINYENGKWYNITTSFRYNDVKTTLNSILNEKPLNNRYKGLITFSVFTQKRTWQYDFTSQFNGGGRISNTDFLPKQYRLPHQFKPYTIINMQIQYKYKLWEFYCGVENVTNFKQKNPIIAADEPFGKYFDSSMIWGPLIGRKIYVGLRYGITRNN